MGWQDRVSKRFNDEPTLPGTVWAQSSSILLYHYTVIYTRLVSHNTHRIQTHTATAISALMCTRNIHTGLERPPLRRGGGNTTLNRVGSVGRTFQVAGTDCRKLYW